MSYEQRGTWVYLVVSIGTYATYVAILLGSAAGRPLADASYVPTMLWAIGISIALSILGRIAVEIVTMSDNFTTDARDKAIDRHGEYVGGLVFAIAIVGPLALTLAEFDHFWIANAIYAAFVLASILSSVVKLVAYRRGI